MNSFRTEKGTELPLLDLRGKSYLQVAHRLVWFREVHPDWSISTDVNHFVAKEYAIAKATIRDESGNIMATAHKHEDKRGFQDYIEKSETGAIGRALALVGFGTQFAPDLDEGDRIVDSPIEPRRLVVTPQPIRQKESLIHKVEPRIENSDNLGDYVPTVGKFEGKPLRTIKMAEMRNYLEWFFKLGPGAKREPSGDWKVMVETMDEYIGGLEAQSPPVHVTEQIPF